MNVKLLLFYLKWLIEEYVLQTHHSHKHDEYIRGEPAKYDNDGLLIPNTVSIVTIKFISVFTKDGWVQVD